MSLSRARALALLCSTPAFGACALARADVRVGSKNFTESFLIAEIYAQALERAGLRVARLFNLGSTQIAMAAMQRGSIDCYPEYTGTALIDVLHLPPIANSRAAYDVVSREFRQRYGIVWLAPSPMDDSQALATTQEIAAARHLATLSDVATAAPQLRFATIQEFLARPDGLPGLQRAYGGFRFASVRTYDIALKYRALLEGHAEIASAFSTDGEVGSDHLVIMRDDRNFWPAYNVAPVVRAAALARRPEIAGLLDAVSRAITDRAARRMNAAIEDLQQDPADVAAAFLKSTSARRVGS
ncbi:MAG TPA: glycine betaine ABC transporter substrate-binding protein [Candidatus Cybelea sp.]|jgi:osmoprotectant transport system substrate-binding protein|nr:glycine betaine ABC transporter substrate-binding protein [Candidatus Cybelea sp.]